MDLSRLVPEPDYLAFDAGLPHMGSSGLGPRTPSRADAAAVMRCTDPVALAHMRGYARSYFAVGGAVVMGAAGTAVLAVLRHRNMAAASALGAGAAALIVMEARRRARQWESLLDARIAALVPGPAAGAAPQ